MKLKFILLHVSVLSKDSTPEVLCEATRGTVSQKEEVKNQLCLFGVQSVVSGGGWGQVGGVRWVGWVGVLTVTYLNGFSPVCVRMWLLSVVAPANARPQYPHLKGRSLE